MKIIREVMFCAHGTVSALRYQVDHSLLVHMFLHHRTWEAIAREVCSTSCPRAHVMN